MSQSGDIDPRDLGAPVEHLSSGPANDCFPSTRRRVVTWEPGSPAQSIIQAGPARRSAKLSPRSKHASGGRGC